ncbi:MAG TPA: YncE family protein [Bryobacteraceae bacterium]|nr:YncE family protein [Bryobacteraceae bacterium]
MQITGAIAAGFAALCLVFSSPALAQSGWHVTKTFKIGGEGRWDYLTVDQQTHRLYVTRSSHTMVIDSESGKTIADIPGQKSAHGVALDPEAGRGFISDGGGSGAVVIFDLKTNAILGKIAAQPDADGIIYDKASDRVLVVSGDGGVLMSLKPDNDPKNGKMDEPIELGGKPEFLASDGAGKVYVNLEDKDKVAVVDMRTRKVIADWPVAPGGEPVGMAINRQEGYLFIGCRKPQKLIVMSTHGGKIVANLPIGAGVDATRTYEHWAFASCGDGTLAVAKEQSPGKFQIVQDVKTPRGARTMEMDYGTRDIYLPTAEFETPKPGAKGRPAMRPGTFMIVVAQPYQ